MTYGYGKNVGSRMYMMDNDNYEMFQLKNQEFSFEVDVSNLPCGLNGALYFVAMEKDGGLGKGNNKAGAKYGTGYCDAQCPKDIKFINGQANILDWKTSGTDSGVGKWGACCAEIDIWEANSVSTAYTMHPCNKEGLYRCENDQDCGSFENRYTGVCDKDGCDLNTYRVGVKDFFGKGMAVDTSRKFRVVTQFITHDGTPYGELSEIKRFYVQDGKRIETPLSNIPEMGDQIKSITDASCDAMKTVMKDTNDFRAKGGLAATGDAMENGMVLVLSLWDDHDANMLWLDSTFPTDKTTWGGPRGSCGTDTGKPDQVESQSANANVVFGKIRIGDIESTW